MVKDNWVIPELTEEERNYKTQSCTLRATIRGREASVRLEVDASGINLMIDGFYVFSIHGDTGRGHLVGHIDSDTPLLLDPISKRIQLSE